MLKSDQTDLGHLQLLVKEQFSRLWGELTTQRLKIEEKAAASLIGQALETLKEIDLGLCDVAWAVLVTEVKMSSKTGNIEDARLVSALLKVLIDRFNSKPVDNDVNRLKKQVEGLLGEVLIEDTRRCDGLIRGPVEEKEVNFVLLVNLLDQFGEVLFFDEVFASVSVSFLLV